MKLYYYAVIQKPDIAGWYPDMNKARVAFGSRASKGDSIIRFAHQGIKPPKGYHKPNGHLAHDAIERIPTMRTLIHALTR